MTNASASHHSAFRVAHSPASAALQLKVTLAVAVALVIGIALGAASIAPRSGWTQASAFAPALTQDAWLVRPATSRG